MKMKKCLTLIALLALAVGSVQADTVTWLGGLYAGTGGGDWTAADNWLSTASGTYALTMPQPGDQVQIDGSTVYGSAPTMPIVNSNVGSVGNLFLGITSGTAGASTLTINNGGNLTSALTGIGWQAGTTGTLDMTGGTHSTAALYLGYSGAGIVNLSGDALLDVTANLAMAVGAVGGTGSITMDGDSMFRILGDSTTLGWENSLITAVGAGDSIDVNLVGGATEYTVIPEPATLGLFALVGGGMLWIRKRFTI